MNNISKTLKPDVSLKAILHLHVISNFITKRITNRIASQPVGVSTCNRNASFRVELVTGSITSSVDMTHTKRSTRLYTTWREMQPAALVKPDLQRHPYALRLLHTPCVPDQICLLVSGERNMRGVRGGGRSLSTKKKTKLEQTDILFTYCKGLSSAGGIPGTPVILHRFVSLDRNSYSQPYRLAL